MRGCLSTSRGWRSRHRNMLDLKHPKLLLRMNPSEEGAEIHARRVRRKWRQRWPRRKDHDPIGTRPRHRFGHSGRWRWRHRGRRGRARDTGQEHGDRAARSHQFHTILEDLGQTVGADGFARPHCDRLVLRQLRLLQPRSEEHTSELQSPCNLVCRLLLEKKKKRKDPTLVLKATE